MAEAAQKSGDIVLIVDDESDIRRILKRLLTDSNVGYRGEIQEASNGDEALTLLRKFGNRIRMVITDFNMPSNAQGKEVAELANSIGIQAIAVITGIPKNFESIKVPVVCFAKPFDIDTVEAWMRQNLFPPAPADPAP